MLARMDALSAGLDNARLLDSQGLSDLRVRRLCSVRVGGHPQMVTVPQVGSQVRLGSRSRKLALTGYRKLQVRTGRHDLLVLMP
jgi:hypothetical protein